MKSVSLIGVDIDELVGFEVSRVSLKAMHSSRRTQERNDRYDRLGNYSWDVSPA